MRTWKVFKNGVVLIFLAFFYLWVDPSFRVVVKNAYLLTFEKTVFNFKCTLSVVSSVAHFTP